MKQGKKTRTTMKTTETTMGHRMTTQRTTILYKITIFHCINSLAIKATVISFAFLVFSILKRSVRLMAATSIDISMAD